MAEPILRIEHFTKRYRSHWTFLPKPAVQDLSLEVFPGEAFGFLGHNGAGKTTTIKCIIGLTSITAGRIIFDGQELRSAAQRTEIGFLPELPYFYDHLSVEETLSLFASLLGLHGQIRTGVVNRVLETLQLTDRRSASVRSLSKGLQQRLGFAQAILHQPKFLLLDEPFSGLDPAGRLDLRHIILDLKKRGTTIFLSSHILSDIEDICDRVAIMAKGELKTVFALRDMPKMFGESFELTAVNVDAIAEELRPHSSFFEVVPDAEGTVVHARYQDAAAAQQAIQKVISSGGRLVSFGSTHMRLEDIFMRITREASRTQPDAGRTPGGAQ